MLRRNTTSNGCSPAFMAMRENMARPANSAMASVIHTTPATGSLPRVGWLRRVKRNAGMALKFPRPLAERRGAASVGHDLGLKIIGITADDACQHDGARCQSLSSFQKDCAINVGCIPV